MTALDQHAEVVMGRVRGVLGAHAPDLLLAFEGLILMDSIAEQKPEAKDAKVNAVVDFLKDCPKPSETPENYDIPVEVKPAVPAILERPVVPPREMPPKITFPQMDMAGKDFDELIASAPKMAYPHDPHDLIQCVRAWAADPEDTRQKIKGHLRLTDQTKVGQVQWAIRWVEYHALIINGLTHVECAEYLQKLLVDRQAVKKAAA